MRIFLLVLSLTTARTHCPVAFTSRIMGGKWKAGLVWALLREEALRYSDLRRACPSISDRVLSKELKLLQRKGRISRREHSTIPPRTDYRLTERGPTLRPVMASTADLERHRIMPVRTPKSGVSGS